MIKLLNKILVASKEPYILFRCSYFNRGKQRRKGRLVEAAIKKRYGKSI